MLSQLGQNRWTRTRCATDNTEPMFTGKVRQNPNSKPLALLTTFVHIAREPPWPRIHNPSIPSIAPNSMLMFLLSKNASIIARTVAVALRPSASETS